jgi:hypothetical protein
VTDWEIYVLQAIYRLEQNHPGVPRTVDTIGAVALCIATETAILKLSPMVKVEANGGVVVWSSR